MKSFKETLMTINDKHLGKTAEEQVRVGGAGAELHERKTLGKLETSKIKITGKLNTRTTRRPKHKVHRS